MIVLEKSLSTLTAKEVLEFLGSGVVEGLQIDYKTSLPGKDISRYFASFSNSRGGIIFFGVPENTKTGLPETPFGLTDPAKVIEVIHQCAANVDPRPQYDVRPFEIEPGNFVVLLRIFEGDRPPYFVQNSGRILIRTGSITDGIKTAEREAFPEEIRRLLGKAQEAEKARAVRIDLGERIYLGTVPHLEKIRASVDPSSRKGFQVHNVGYKPLTAMLSIKIQPLYPRNEITSVSEIGKRLREYACASANYGFPECISRTQSTHGGVLHYDFYSNSGPIVEQLNCFGYLEKRVNVLLLDNSSGQIKKNIATHSIFGHVLTFLVSSGLFYKTFQYVGPLQLSVDLDTSEIENLEIDQMSTGPKTLVIPSFLDWVYTLETTALQDNPSLRAFMLAVGMDLYQSLGLNHLDEMSFDRFLRAEGINLT